MSDSLKKHDEQLAKEKRERLEAAGWKVGTVGEFLELSEEEEAELEEILRQRPMPDPDVVIGGPNCGCNPNSKQGVKDHGTTGGGSTRLQR